MVLRATKEMKESLVTEENQVLNFYSIIKQIFDKFLLKLGKLGPVGQAGKIFNVKIISLFSHSLFAYLRRERC